MKRIAFISPFLAVTFFTSSLFASSEEGCQSTLKSQNWFTLTVEKFCAANSSRAKDISQNQFERCFKEATPIIAIENLQPTFSALCFSGGRNFKFSDLDLGCLKSYSSILSESYLAFDDLAKEKDSANGYKSLAEEILKSCKPGNYSRVRDNTQIQIVGRTTFHTLEGVHNTPYPLGGLSGIAKVRKNFYVTVSDDRHWPRVSYFSLAQQPGLYSQFRLKQEKTRLLVGKFLDLEDLAILKTDGDEVSQFIFTTEELFNPEIFSTLQNNSTEAPPRSYVFATSESGSFSHNVQIPPIYYSHSWEMDALCGKKEENAFIGFFKGIFNYSERKAHMASLTPEQREKCKQYEQNDGIRYNRGIESLAISNDRKFLYYTTEQAILFDGKLSETLHLTRQSLANNGEYDVFTYPYSAEGENGVVGLLYLNNDTLISLERGFDAKKKEASVSLYQIRLVKDAKPHVEKTLMVHMSDLLSQMPPGLRSVDNFEGIALGPDIDARNFSVVLVSDNNFSLKQKTDFVVIKIPNEWKGR